MADEIIIETTSAEVIEVGVPGPQGPAGAAGTGLETLTTKGDTLYRGDTTGERLPIGTTGQILRVSASGIPEWGSAPASGVSSVNGETGAVTLDGSEIDTSGNDDLAAFVTYEFADGNGLYYPLPDTTIGNKRVYRTTTGHHVFFENLRWHITDGSPITANIIESSDDDNAAWPWLSAWNGSIEKAQLSTVVGRARSTFLFVGDSIPNTSVSGLAAVAASGGYDDLSGKPTIPSASTATPAALGTAAAGTATAYARADHVHAMPNASALLSTGAGEGDLPVAQGDGTVAWQNGTTWAGLNITAQDIGAAPASHTHAASDITSGSFGNISHDGKLGSTAGLPVVTTTAGAVTTLALGTAGQVLQVNSGATGVEFAASGGGVTTGSVDNAVLRADGVSGSQSQSSDINIEDAATTTQNNVAITNQHSGQTNSALVLTPKGTGGIIFGEKPTGSSSSGNARGVNATDLCLVRTSAANVAAGERSALLGGANNRAGGQDSAVISGTGNTASGFQAVILGGRNNSCTNDRSFALGDQNSVSGNTAMAVGANNTCSGINAIALSSRSLADRSCIMAHAGGMFAATGDAQRIRAVLRCTTTTNAAVEMALDGGTTYLTIPSGKVMYGEIYVVGVRAGGADVAIYRAVYAAKNIGGTSTEVFSSVTTDAATGTSLEIATVDAGDSIRIRPTGVASQNWRWVAKVDLVEVAHG